MAILCRGPTDWAHVGRWDLSARRYEPGAWLRGRIFPRRSDLSADGRYLCTFVHKPNAAWTHGETYVSVSKLPWLTALHAFGTDGTWTRGYHFVPAATEPGDVALLRGALRATRVEQFAAERRRGFVASEGAPSRAAGGAWDEGRNARVQKRQPGGAHVLHLESVGAAFGAFGVDQAVDGLRVRYAIAQAGVMRPLDDLQWADWDHEGRLLAATRSGTLQMLGVERTETRVLWEESIAHASPDPRPAPDHAARW